MNKKSPCLSALTSVILLHGASTAYAVEPEQEKEQEQEHELAPVVVQGTALPTFSKPPSDRTAMPTSVQAQQIITREDIQAMRPRDIFDLVETSLGMDYTRQGSRVNNFTTNRGGSVGYLLDGVYLTATQAQRVVGDIPVDMIESIEFVRDSSVLGILPVMGFGSRVSTPNQGVIIINTASKPGSEDGARLKASYATYDTWTTGGNVRKSWQDGKLQLGGGYQHSASAGKPDWNMAYKSDSYLFNGGWKDESFMAMASVFVNRGEREIQRYIGVMNGPTSALKKGELGTETWKYDPRDTQGYSVNLARYWNAQHTTALTWGRTTVGGTGWYYSTTTDPDTVPSRDFKDESTDLNLSHTITGEKNVFKAGLQRVGYLQQTETTSAQTPAPREEEIYGIYLSDEYWITPSWSVDGSARQDRKHVIEGGDKYSADGTTMKVSDDTWTDRATLLALGSAWQINPVWRVSGRYAWSTTPTPDTIPTLNNKSLPAEQLSRWELGLDAKLHPALEASFTPFYYVIKNAKVATTTNVSVYNPDTGSYENLSVYDTADEVIRKGYELALKGRLLGNAVGYELGISHFTDDSVTPSSGQVETPENRYTGRVNWAHGAWLSSLSVLKVDGYCHYFKNGCLPTGDYTTVNLNVRRKFAHDITVALYGQNITDEHYYTRHKTGAGGPAYAQSQGAIVDVGATWGIEVGVDF